MGIQLRIIVENGPKTAAFNMATDLYLLGECRERPAVFVRFYTWQPAAISIGYMQKAEEVLDERALESGGVSWIRRPTGGRAVLHEGDLTYSCVFSKKIPAMGSSVARSYDIISQCLIKGFAEAGIACSRSSTPLDARRSRAQMRLPCFLAPNRDEIMVEGKKLVGSAQKRGVDGVLQHGSIPCTPAFRKLALYQKAGKKEREAVMRLLERTCVCISEIDSAMDTGFLTRCLCRGFASTLPFTVQESSWESYERERIEEMAGSDEFRRQWMA